MKVRRKIIDMKAAQWLGTPESLEEIKKVGTIDEISYFERSNSLYFCSLNRPSEITKVGVNDWIIEEVAGVRHLCRSYVFEKIYAVVEEKEVLDINLSYLRDTVNSSLIRTAIKRFSEVVNGLECECDSCNAYTCIIQNDKVLAERALKVLEPAPKTTICEYTDLDGEGTCDYTNERCRFKNVENCKNFIEDEIVGTTNFKGFKIVLTPIPRNSEDPIICEGCGASDYDPWCLKYDDLAAIGCEDCLKGLLYELLIEEDSGDEGE